MAFYFLTSLYYNSRTMNRKTSTPGKTQLVKYQIYLSSDLQERLAKYLEESFTKRDTVYTATFRKAIDEFLEKRGY